MRRRFIQRGLELIEVTGEDRDRARRADHILWNDRAYQDANDSRFTSRTTHREFMKRENLTTIDDFKEQFKRDREKRLAFYRGEDSSRKADIARAMEKSRG